MEENKKATYVTQKLDVGNAKPIEVNNTPKIVKTTAKNDVIYEVVEVKKYNKKTIIFLIIALIVIVLIFLIFELPMIINK